MSDQPYTPNIDAVANAYSYACNELRGIDTDDYSDVAEFDRFIAQVKRDAAREALDGLARESMGAFKGPHSPPDPRSWAEVAGAVEWYRDTNYPETEDQT